MQSSELIERLAELLDYPDAQTPARAAAVADELQHRAPEAAAALAAWRSYLAENSVAESQELFTQTFDLNPACSLDVGYYLFGEDYQRGLFLAQLRESQEELGLAQECELPDHLPVLMRWLARVWGTELHTDMVSECVLPALHKMDECFANSDNPYRGVLQAIAEVLERDLGERGIPTDKTIEDRGQPSLSQGQGLISLDAPPQAGAPAAGSACRPSPPAPLPKTAGRGVPGKVALFDSPLPVVGRRAGGEGLFSAQAWPKLDGLEPGGVA